MTERATFYVWDEEPWRRRVFYGETIDKPICRRYSREAAFTVAGWLTAFPQVGHRTVVVEERATGSAWTVRGGSLL